MLLLANGELFPLPCTNPASSALSYSRRDQSTLTTTYSTLALPIVLIYYLWTMGSITEHPNLGANPIRSHIAYTPLAGFFLQSLPTTDPLDFDYLTSNLGLINRSYPTDSAFDPDQRKSQWQRFHHYVRHLNAESPPNTQIKLLYLARHGQGFHNVAESHYGTRDWDCYWSKLDGNGTITWADARLTSVGEDQALAARKFFAAKLEAENIPVPEAFYVSPLERCLKTAKITWGDVLDLPEDDKFRPMVKELLREALGVHTCDRRSDRTYITKNYPHYAIERGFEEDDPLWDPDIRESDSHMVVRLKKLLDDIFSQDENVVISLTSHSGAIGAMLRALGHREFGLQTGGVIPVLVKAERIDGLAPSSSIDPGIPAPTCSPTGEARI